MWRRIGGLGVLVLVAASCGPTGHTTMGSAEPSHGPSIASMPSATPTATPTPAGPLAACVGAPEGEASAVWGFAVTAGQVTEVVSPDGSVIGQAPSTTGAATVTVPVGVGLEGLYLYNESTGELSVLGKTGSAQDLGHISPTGPTDDVSLAESPNGQCWILSDTSWDNSMTATSRLYIGGAEVAPYLVATLTRANQVSGTWGGGYQALRWDSSGVLLGADPTSVGGAGPFIGDGYGLATVVRMDPLSGTVSPPLCTKGRFGDVAPDGTLACLTGQESDAQIVVTRPDGSTTTIDTGMKVAGQIGFAGGSSLLTYCTSDDVWNADGWTTDLLTVRLSGHTVSTSTLSSGDGPNQNESAYPWDKIVNGSSIVEIRGASGSTSLVMTNLATGQTTTIAPADSIIGVL